MKAKKTEHSLTDGKSTETWPELYDCQHMDTAYWGDIGRGLDGSKWDNLIVPCSPRNYYKYMVEVDIYKGYRL